MTDTLEVAGLRFEVRRSPRRKTLGLTVDRGGQLVIHSPEATDEQQLVHWARSKLLWVHSKLALKDRLASRAREPEYVNGESFSYLGRSYRLMIVMEQEEPLRLDGDRFLLRADTLARANDQFRRWYAAVGREWIATRARTLARRIGTSPSRVEVRELGFRWGSCGKKGVVYFNWRLLQLPMRVADYVIAHELAHLLEPHHRPEFWCTLDRSLPDWREREEELRARARHVYWCGASMRQ